MAGAVSRYAVMVGFVSVLAARVCVEPKLTNESEEFGKVYELAPAITNVLAKAPVIVSVLPTLLATPVPPLFAGRVPVTPVERGRPVAFVNTPLVGVPNSGVTSVGEVSVLFVSVSVVARPTRVSVEVGKVSVGVPATAGVTIVAVPDVLPVIATAVLLTDLPAVKLLTATLTVVPD